MKTILLFCALLLGSGCAFGQVAKVRFLDGSFGYAISPKLSLHRVGDTLTFESLDQKVWRIMELPDSSMKVKEGVIQKIVSSNQDVFAKVDFISGSGDIVDDFSLSLFNVGDTIQVVKRKDSEGEDINRVYYGQLPGKQPEETKLAIIRKIVR